MTLVVPYKNYSNSKDAFRNRQIVNFNYIGDIDYDFILSEDKT